MTSRARGGVTPVVSVVGPDALTHAYDGMSHEHMTRSGLRTSPGPGFAGRCVVTGVPDWDSPPRLEAATPGKAGMPMDAMPSNLDFFSGRVVNILHFSFDHLTAPVFAPAQWRHTPTGLHLRPRTNGAGCLLRRADSDTYRALCTKERKTHATSHRIKGVRTWTAYSEARHRPIATRVAR